MNNIKIYCVILACIGIIINSHILAGEFNDINISPAGNWLEFDGKKVLLVGDSVTQGWMELGANFNQNAYIDALSERGINAVLVWSYIGIINQNLDRRIGYDAPEIWPWIKADGKFDLIRFNQFYFDRLRAFVEYAHSKRVVVIITVHDGWTKGRFSGHPFNMSNGGPLTDKAEFVELADYANEMPLEFNPEWNKSQKQQYFLERFCERLIQVTADLPNVMYEIFNEGEWYDQTKLRAFQMHFLRFFKARTSHPIIINDDHVGGEDFHRESGADIISLHRPQWNPESFSREFFTHFTAQFKRLPPKPYILTETIPDYRGVATSHDETLWHAMGNLVRKFITEDNEDNTGLDGIMRLMWGTALAGASVMIQNDTSFGFDPNAAISSEADNRDMLLDLEGHLARFFNASGIKFYEMTPNSSLASTGVVLGNIGKEYIVYSDDSDSFTIDLSSSTDDFIGRFYDPRTGAFGAEFIVHGGSPSERIIKPDSGDWVFHLAVAS